MGNSGDIKVSIVFDYRRFFGFQELLLFWFSFQTTFFSGSEINKNDFFYDWSEIIGYRKSENVVSTVTTGR